MSDPQPHSDEPQDDGPVVTDEERMLFDAMFESVLDELPRRFHELIEEVPIVVEDYPGDEVLDELEIEDASELCGLHTGIPLTERSTSDSGVLGDVIHIYRDGILNLVAEKHQEVVKPETLRVEIRITVLHEIGHHFGLDEEDLRKLGYE
ncbi:MAG: metallopeptidase family protein [Phycisphaeraceae bacterium]